MAIIETFYARLSEQRRRGADELLKHLFGAPGPELPVENDDGPNPDTGGGPQVRASRPLSLGSGDKRKWRSTTEMPLLGGVSRTGASPTLGTVGRVMGPTPIREEIAGEGERGAFFFGLAGA